METDAPSRKPGGRLSRDDQRRLGDILQRVYDDVVKQGVPDRFKNLLQELDEGADNPHVRTAMPSSVERPEQGKGDDATDDDALPDRLMDDQDLADPGRNGSH
jgi:hypothetical protein